MEPTYIVVELFEAAKWLRRGDGIYLVDPHYLQEFLTECNRTE